MKFIKDGPNIPDELLLALDEGRVVFFCGAGVSQAKAKLPDFFGLVDKVRTILGDLDDSLSAKNLPSKHDKSNSDIIGDSKEKPDIQSTISADHIFSLLEQDFSKRNIECAVAKALVPEDNDVVLEAHKILLNIATGKDGITKLITTNFDRLFDDCKRDLKTWQLSKLPNPTRPEDMNGIIYLHGRVTENYKGAEGNGFILSSEDFGEAYLAKGWATDFFKNVTDCYTIVFVGYSAGDPPVHYLLKGLSKSNDRLNKIYAFQSGSADYAVSRWNPKGVKAIPYDDKDDHAALWDTLEKWAKRIRDPERWQEKIIEMALRGPETLASFEREQVANLVSTKEGARKFLKSDPSVPATWLGVFDSSIRYSNPEQDENGYIVDPFTHYGLASDNVSESIHPDDYEEREIPDNAWDAFKINHRDQLELGSRHVTPLRGKTSLVSGLLPDRIKYLGLWISKVSNQNAAVWWAVRQSGLHEKIQEEIRWNLKRNNIKYLNHIRQSWNYLFEHWRAERNKNRLDWYDFVAETGNVWSKKTIQKYEEIFRPYLILRKSDSDNTAAPQINEETTLKDLIRPKIVYNKSYSEILIPDECLDDVVSVLKRNLDIGIELEIECNYYGIKGISPIIPSDDPDITSFERNRGLSGAVIFYTKLFERLIDIDVKKARYETETWSTVDNNVFARLRIWASRFEKLIPNDDFDEFFGKVSREAFWDRSHQRDLLLTLQQRWPKLPKATTRLIEKRILEGPEQWQKEKKQDFVLRNAFEILDRIYWLDTKNCRLNINLEKEINRLKNNAPGWTPEHAKNADRSREMRAGVFGTDTEHSALLKVPLSQVLIKAQEMNGRNWYGFVDYDPFAGLSGSYPVRALAALRLKAKSGEYPEWAWRGFLHSKKRKDDKLRFKNFIAELLVLANDEALKEIIYLASEWLLSVTNDMTEECVPIFEKLITRLLNFLSDNSDANDSDVACGGSDPDWATEALNSSAGNIAQILYHDPRFKNHTKKQELPVEWRKLVENSLALPGDNSRFALIFYCYHLNRFYKTDPEWTEKNLLSILQSDDTRTLEAWWNGYFWGVSRLPSPELFQILKPYLLEKKFFNKTFKKSNNHEKFAELILLGWGASNNKSISDNEFRKVLLSAGYDFRSHILSQFTEWSNRKNGKFWKLLRKQFLRQVWPIQKTARTPQDSARLIEFAFSDEEGFIAISDAILPLVGKIESDLDIRLFPSEKEGEWRIVDKYPERVLEILYRALPESANKWPYKIDTILKRIVDVNLSLQTDIRWIELTRRWSSR